MVLSTLKCSVVFSQIAYGFDFFCFRGLGGMA
jgi:hypothetical protein